VTPETLPELFARALELDDSRRQDLLAAIGRSDPELAARLSRLLASSGVAGSVLDRPAWQELADEDAPASADEPPPPEQVGPYRIVREIGRGGMGRVFLAREETADYSRTVALKIIASPAPEALRRFRDEVRILSALDHPGIARFIDGGRAPDGTWFLALEHIQGEDLLTYARRTGASLERRIELFLDVLATVAFAHLQGVVHRDLKPSHLLIGPDGRPRLLDFGISKLLDPEMGGEGLAVTRTESRALTPAYASPEQFRGENVTPASDVYSLGVVLYELLAGRRPFAGNGESRAALERAVIASDPEPPSRAALATHRTEGEAAGERSPSRPGLRTSASGIGRDLDAICLKALRKRPEDRYPTAEAFAADLRRHLEGRPVEARRGDWLYRSSSFAFRHRGRLAIAGALAVAAVALFYAARASRVERAVPPPLPPPSAAGSTPEAVPVDELERRFAAAPSSVEAGCQLAAELARNGRAKEAELVIARVRLLPGASDDPLVDQTEAMAATVQRESQRALALVTRALSNARARGRGGLVPNLRLTRARSLSDLGQPDEAQAELERARRDAEIAGDATTLAMALNDLAVDQLRRGNLAEGERLLLQALERSRTLPDASRAGFILENLGGIAFERGRPDLAEVRYREAIQAFEKADRKRRAAIASGNLAEALWDLGRAAEAASVRDRAITALRALDDTSVIANLVYSRADAALDAGDVGGVEAEAAAIESTALANGHRRNLAKAEELRGRAAWRLGDAAMALARLSEARRIHIDDGDLDLASAVDVELAEIALTEKRPADATELLEAALRRIEGGADSTTALLADALRVRVAVGAGRTDEARRFLAAIGDAAATSPSLSRRLAFLRSRAALAGREGRAEDARRDLLTAIDSAQSGDRTVAALELRLDLLSLERETGDPDLAGLAKELESDATRLGLRGIAARARRTGQGASTDQ
jgi:serine/threonine protein kinase